QFGPANLILIRSIHPAAQIPSARNPAISDTCVDCVERAFADRPEEFRLHPDISDAAPIKSYRVRVTMSDKTTRSVDYTSLVGAYLARAQIVARVGDNGDDGLVMVWPQKASLGLSVTDRWRFLIVRPNAAPRG